MKKRFYIPLIGMLSICMACTKPVVTADYHVIPLPQEIVLSQGEGFVIDPDVKIVYPTGNAKMQANAAFLAAFVKEANGVQPEITDGVKSGKMICLELDTTFQYPEGYRIIVENNRVRMIASTEAGIFYGIQTLHKALPIAEEHPWVVTLPAGSITDFPRFKYRGLLLDVGRHYFPVAYLKQFLDLLALHNINTFHWHLTEDQGWRIEIKKYPELTKIGSHRKETIVDWETKKMDGQPYGGFYTQDEVREIVAYATERYITVIPEIDMPGHMTAALVSYPELGCTGGPYEVPTSWGVFPEVLCAGNERSLEFVKDVLTEVMELFPSSYIHIVGDECPKQRLKKCPKCQAMIRKNGIKAKPGHTSENQLQTWFMTEVEKFINSKGRKMIGWDEVLDGGLTPDATIMSWRGIQGGIKAAQQHHDVIMTPISFLYFSNPHILKLQGLETVMRVYNYEPVPKDLSEEEREYVLGAQASIWTEWIKDSSRLEYVTLPRLAAASEIFWTDPDKKEMEGFLKRLPHLLELYARAGYEYRKDIYNPYIRVKKLGKDSAEISCRTFDNQPVYYTLDGSLPDSLSPLYSQPFVVTKGTQIKAVTVREGVASEIQTVEY